MNFDLNLIKCTRDISSSSLIQLLQGHVFSFVIPCSCKEDIIHFVPKGGRKHKKS